MACLKYLLITLFVCFIKAEDYYELLGVEKNADNRDIRRAFKKLALKMHPDKNPNDKEAHERFIKINRAYEVLKDEEMRKKYDLHGEAGLEADFGKGNYRSWNYYYESFGIYDDDPEIITLSHSDFDQSVVGSPDVWFINFYSPQCSHCHQLAPAWRAMARELEGVIRIGAVNCEEDWMLCRQQNVHSYPSLVMYPQREKYRGGREVDDMISHVLRSLPNKVIELTMSNLATIVSLDEYRTHPWLISVCVEDDECISKEVLKKLSIILDGLVSVGKVDIRSSKKICKKLDCTTTLSYYQNITLLSKDNKGHEVDERETKSIANEVLKLLPAVQELTEGKFMEIQEELKSLTAQPWVVDFTKDSSLSDFSGDTELKRLRALLPNVHIGFIDCQRFPKLCSSWFVHKFPKFIVFKPGGSHEFHHGRFTAHDIATFVRESLSSQVQTLTPSNFPAFTELPEPWFIDFFAPWCPPCMQLLPEWRKLSRIAGHMANFGTVDCTVHAALCNKYKIHSYPTTILFNQSIPHKFHGSHNRQQMKEFIEDIIRPRVIELTDSSFNEVKTKPKNIIWVIDYYAPWCGPCQQLGPQWRKLAKLLKNDENIHIGSVDCTKYSSLCSEMGVNSYPTIRLYPLQSMGVTRFHFYNGWHRDAVSLQAWIYGFLPSKVTALGSDDFNKVLADPEPWLIDFYAPWCGHCQTFAPEFEKVAKAMEGKVRAGKVNCENLPHVCRMASVRAYPTVMLYRGAHGRNIQNSVGMELHHMSFGNIISFVEDTLGIKIKHPRHDEL